MFCARVAWGVFQYIVLWNVRFNAVQQANVLVYRRNKKERGRVWIGVASVERLFHKPERRALLARIQGTGFCVGESALCQPKFYDGRHLDVYILPCSYALDRTNPGRIRNENMQHPLRTLKRLNIWLRNPTPWSLSTKLNVFIHSDHTQKRSNASAFFSQQVKVLRQGQAAQDL